MRKPKRDTTLCPELCDWKTAGFQAQQARKGPFPPSVNLAVSLAAPRASIWRRFWFISPSSVTSQITEGSTSNTSAMDRDSHLLDPWWAFYLRITQWMNNTVSSFCWEFLKGLLSSFPERWGAEVTSLVLLKNLKTEISLRERCFPLKRKCTQLMEAALCLHPRPLCRLPGSHSTVCFLMFSFPWFP